MNPADLHVGKNVHYLPEHGKPENGIISSMRVDDGIVKVWVVYNCGGNWKSFQSYTAALTPLEHLRDGWTMRARNFDNNMQYNYIELSQNEGELDISDRCEVCGSDNVVQGLVHKPCYVRPESLNMEVLITARCPEHVVDMEYVKMLSNSLISHEL